MYNYKDLLVLLQKYVTFFEELTVTEQEKLDAARAYDIAKLESCMKKEQADTLVLRGFDKKRLLIQESLSLEGLTFRQLIPSLPEEYQYDFSQTFQKLNDAYALYQSTGSCAKQAIEINIHRVELAMEDLKKRTHTASGTVYSSEGILKPDHVTFKDMRI